MAPASLPRPAGSQAPSRSCLRVPRTSDLMLASWLEFWPVHAGAGAHPPSWGKGVTRSLLSPRSACNGWQPPSAPRDAVPSLRCCGSEALDIGELLCKTLLDKEFPRRREECAHSLHNTAGCYDWLKGSQAVVRSESSQRTPKSAAVSGRGASAGQWAGRSWRARCWLRTQVRTGPRGGGSATVVGPRQTSRDQTQPC